MIVSFLLFLLLPLPVSPSGYCNYQFSNLLAPVSGQLTLVLDDGEERTLTEPGSVVIQRGTMHLWENRSQDTWARYIIVVIDASPIHVPGPDGRLRALPEGIQAE